MSAVRLFGFFTLLMSFLLLLQACRGSSSNGTYPLTILTYRIDAYYDVDLGKQSPYTRVIPFQMTAEGGAPVHGYNWSITPGTSSPIPEMTLDPATGVVSGGIPPSTGGAPFDCPDSPGVVPCGARYDLDASVSDGTDTANKVISVYVYHCESLNYKGEPQGACVVDNHGDVTSDPFDAAGAAYNSHPVHNPYYAPINFEYFGATRVQGTNIPAGIPFGLSMNATGGRPPYKDWYIYSGSLPPGLKLDPDRGVIWGTPMMSDRHQTYDFSVGASDSFDNPSPNLSQNQVPLIYELTIGPGTYQSPYP